MITETSYQEKAPNNSDNLSSDPKLRRQMLEDELHRLLVSKNHLDYPSFSQYLQKNRQKSTPGLAGT
jgi:hypothetical protein